MNIEKGYKICTIVDNPKIYKMITLGRLSGKLGFIYSYKAVDTDRWGESMYWEWNEGNNILSNNSIYPCDDDAPCDLSYGEFNARENVSLSEEDKEYWMSFIDLVQENKVCNEIDTSESYKPLYYGKMFLTIGVSGWYKNFQKLGFKLYDELFDYSFDDIQPFDERWKHIMNQCDNILEMSIEELQDKEQFLKPKIDFNAKRIRELS